MEKDKKIYIHTCMTNGRWCCMQRRIKHHKGRECERRLCVSQSGKGAFSDKVNSEVVSEDSKGVNQGDSWGGVPRQ